MLMTLAVKGCGGVGFLSGYAGERDDGVSVGEEFSAIGCPDLYAGFVNVEEKNKTKERFQPYEMYPPFARGLCPKDMPDRPDRHLLVIRG